MDSPAVDTRAAAEQLWDARYRDAERVRAEAAKLPDSPWKDVLLAAAWRRLGSWERCLQLLLDALPQLLEDDTWLGRGLDQLASVLSDGGEEGLAEIINDRAQASLTRGGDRVGLAAAVQNHATASHLRPSDKLMDYHRALAIAETTAHPDLVGLICLNVVATMRSMGSRLDQMEPYQARAERCLGESWPADHVRALASRAELLLDEGRLDEAEARIAALGTWRDHAEECVQADLTNVRVLLLRAQGRWQEAVQELADYLPHAAAYRAPGLAAALSELCEEAGRAEDALRWAREQNRLAGRRTGPDTGDLVRIIDLWCSTQPEESVVARQEP